MYAKKLIDFKSTLKTGFNPMTQVIGRFLVSSVIISVLILWMASLVVAQGDQTSYPTFNQGKWKIEVLFTPKFAEEKIKSIDLDLESYLDLNFSLSEKIAARSRSWFDLSGLKKQQVTGQLRLVELNSTVSSQTVFDPNLHKEILTFTTYQVKRVKLSSSLLLFFSQTTDSPEKLSYEPGIVAEGEWRSKAGIKLSSVTGFGATVNKRKVYKGLNFQEEILKASGRLLPHLNLNLIFSITSRFGREFDYSWTKLDLRYPLDWLFLRLRGAHGKQNYDTDDDDKEETTFGINKLTPEVQLNLNKTRIRSNFTYGPNFEDIDEDGANEKVSNYTYKKTTVYLSTNLGNFNLSHYMVLRPDSAWQRFRMRINMNDWVPGLELQFSQTKLQKLIFSLTTKF